MAKELTGRTALVTGAGSGIGVACARRLAADGARVLVVDRQGEPAERVAAERVAAEVGGLAVVTDLSVPGFADGLPDEPVDIVVNNAGFQHVAPVEEFPPEVFSTMLKVMVEAPFLIARRVLPGMYARGWGRIVKISSVHGLRASPYKSAYITAKHALEGFSKTLALEGAPHGVTSTYVCPAFVRTALVEGQIVHRARRLLATDTAYLTLHDPARGDTYMRVTDGSISAKFRALRLAMGAGLGGLVAQTAVPYSTTSAGRSPATRASWTPACSRPRWCARCCCCSAGASRRPRDGYAASCSTT